MLSVLTTLPFLRLRVIAVGGFWVIVPQMPAFITVLVIILPPACAIDELVAQRPIFSTAVRTSGCTGLQVWTGKAATFIPRHKYTRVVGFVSIVYVFDLYGCARHKASMSSSMAANRAEHDNHKHGALGITWG